MVKTIIIKAQPKKKKKKKKSGRIWNVMRELKSMRFGLMWGRANLMWQLLEKIKKISQLHLLIYI